VHEWEIGCGGRLGQDVGSTGGVAKILFLAHRFPFPPNKGDKIRAYHMLRHLWARHDVWLGACADEPEDLRLLDEAIAHCEDVCVVPLHPVRRALNMAVGAASGAPLSVARFRHPRLACWIDEVLRDVQPDLVFVYSSALAQYVIGNLPADTRLVVDFVDADTEKWRAYAAAAAPPLRWVYAAEHDRLARFERQVIDAAKAGIFISDVERALFAGLAGVESKLRVIPNGVDTDYFQPTSESKEPDSIVLCGRMDYRPNIDAALWFAHSILPKVRTTHPDAVFRIVGAQPPSRVLALAHLPGVEVTGAVPDVRPYVARAAVVVAPLRIARGIQNKVLEGMAFGRPVVATPAALEGIDAVIGREVLVAADADRFAAAVSDVLSGAAPAELGARARQYVVEHFQWDAQLEALDRLIADLSEWRSGEAPA
jgi:sugar transferase (PEP-CTERM/EpsH1 system associated)